MKVSICAALLFAAAITRGTARPVVTEGKGTEWKYWTGESVLPANWQTPGFDDKAWLTGVAPLGIGEERLTTIMKPAANGGPPTVALFRKAFFVPRLEKGDRNYPAGYPHAWNEIHLDDGTRLLVDSSYRAGKWDFPDVNTPFIVKEYRKLDNSPLYGKDAIQ